jgi:hypothetical protein
MRLTRWLCCTIEASYLPVDAAARVDGRAWRKDWDRCVQVRGLKLKGVECYD